MADRFGAKVTLLHVTETSFVHSEFGVPPLYHRTELERDAEKQLDSFLPDLFPLGSCSRVVGTEDPASVVTQYVQDQSADLVMMPTHGFGMFRRLLIGSVTAKLLHDLAVPVWTGVHLEEPDYGQHVGCKNIICAIDLGASSVPLMQFASQLGAKCGAIVRLAHAVPVAHARPGQHLDLQLAADPKEFARQQIARLQREASTNFEVCIEDGNVSEMIRLAAQYHAADLVVIGRGEITHLMGRLRTHAYSIIRDSPCPVLSV